jgi:Kef-type K+ transport system membrane component KefB
MDMVKLLFGGVRPGIAPLVVALAGVGLAYLWDRVSVLLAIAIALAFIVSGVVAYYLGRSCLRRDKPKAQAARRRFEWTVAAPVGLAAFAAAAIIVVAIEFAAEKSWSEEKKQLIAAAVAAITTFLTTAFVKGTGEADAGLVASLGKERFETDLKGRFPQGTAAQNAVFDLIRGWGRAARKKRAEEIDTYVESNGKIEPRTP